MLQCHLRRRSDLRAVCQPGGRDSHSGESGCNGEGAGRATAAGTTLEWQTTGREDGPNFDRRVRPDDPAVPYPAGSFLQLRVWRAQVHAQTEVWSDV